MLVSEIWHHFFYLSIFICSGKESSLLQFLWSFFFDHLCQLLRQNRSSLSPWAWQYYLLQTFLHVLSWIISHPYKLFASWYFKHLLNSSKSYISTCTFCFHWNFYCLSSTLTSVIFTVALYANPGAARKCTGSNL